jgi:hypothetical protein
MRYLKVEEMRVVQFGTRDFMLMRLKPQVHMASDLSAKLVSETRRRKVRGAEYLGPLRGLRNL